jgi:hypothetical protein
MHGHYSAAFNHEILEGGARNQRGRHAPVSRRCIVSRFDAGETSVNSRRDHHDTAVEHPLRPKRRSLINFSRIGGLHASHGGSA